MRIRMQMMILILSLLLISFCVGGNILIARSHDYTLAREKEHLEEEFGFILKELETTNIMSENFAVSDIVDYLEQSEEQIAFEDMYVWLSEGENICYQSDASKFLIEKEKFNSANCEGKGKIIEVDGGKYYYLSVGLSFGNKELEFVVAYDITEVFENRNQQVETYQSTFLIIFIIGAIATFVISNMFTKPLRQLSKTSREISEGNLQVRANVSSRNEIGEVAKDFNIMTDKLVFQIEKIEHNMKMQEEFMGSFAHELKTPMTAIVGYVSLLRMENLSDSEQQEAYHFIHSESKRLLNLSKKLLALFQLDKQTYVFEYKKMKALLSEIVQTFMVTINEKEIEVLLDCDDSYWNIEADLIKSLIWNLLDNAQKAIESKGIIQVIGRKVPSGYELKVKDNGKGFPQSEIPRLTEAFYRVDKSRSRKEGGVGLGLSLCKKIVELHNGTIQFSVLDGQATCVTILLREGNKCELQKK